MSRLTNMTFLLLTQMTCAKRYQCVNVCTLQFDTGHLQSKQNIGIEQ